MKFSTEKYNGTLSSKTTRTLRLTSLAHSEDDDSVIEKVKDNIEEGMICHESRTAEIIRMLSRRLFSYFQPLSLRPFISPTTLYDMKWWAFAKSLSGRGSMWILRIARPVIQKLSWVLLSAWRMPVPKLPPLPPLAAPCWMNRSKMPRVWCSTFKVHVICPGKMSIAPHG